MELTRFCGRLILREKGVPDAQTSSTIPPKFQQMVGLVRAGRTPEERSREFEPTAQAIRNWVHQVDRDEVVGTA